LQLYLLRHGPAGSRDASLYPDDGERPLTRPGRARTERAARGMETAGFRFDLLLTSPLARARQTADIVAEVVSGCPRPRVHRPLAPGGPTEAILEGLPKGRQASRVLLVGHEPDLTRLAADLLLPGNPALSMTLRKGGLIRIDFDDHPSPGDGRLVLLLTPKILRGL